MGALIRGWVSCAFSVLISLTAYDATACLTLEPDPSLVGSPANGDVDVPTDVIPYYSLWTIRESSPSDIPLSLVSADGDAIELTVLSNSVNVFELIPHRTLEPNTEYTLSATLNTYPDGTGEDIVDQVTFTTGAGAFDGTPEPPEASVTHYHFQGILLDSCDPLESGTCVAIQRGLPVLVEFGGASDTYLYDASYFTNLSGINQGTPWQCVILRTRAPDATLSAPLDLCRRDGPLYALGGTNIDCTPEGLTQDGELVTGDTVKDGSGGTGGTGGITITTGSTGGMSTTGGTGAVAGATVGEATDRSAAPSDRKVAGCTCRAGRASSHSTVAVVALLAGSVVLRRSSTKRRRARVQ